MAREITAQLTPEEKAAILRLRLQMQNRPPDCLVRRSDPGFFRCRIFDERGDAGY